MALVVCLFVPATIMVNQDLHHYFFPQKQKVVKLPKLFCHVSSYNNAISICASAVHFLQLSF